MNYEGITIVSATINQGARIILHNGGTIFKYDEESGQVVVTIAVELYEAIPRIDLLIGELPDPDDIYDNLIDLEDGSPFRGTCYFGISSSTGLIKIGYSIDFNNRKRCYKTHSPEPLNFYAMPGNRPLESRFHRFFKPIRHHGEWYYPHPALLDYILLSQ